MRITFVFSSPTPGTNEFENVWKNCPGCKGLGSDKLVIEGEKWKIFAFDGLSKKYYSSSWNFQTIQSELTSIMEEHKASVFGIFLHGTKKELSLLVEQLQIPNVQEIYHKWYTSSRGTFFKKCIKPFSNNDSDMLFEKLWAKLEKEKDVKNDNPGPKDQLIFISHRLTGMIRSMRMIVEDAKEDINLLQDFKRFDFEYLLKEYQKVEPQVKNLGILEINEAPERMKHIQEIINEFSKRDTYSLKDLKLGSSCLEKTEALHDIVKQASEVINE